MLSNVEGCISGDREAIARMCVGIVVQVTAVIYTFTVMYAFLSIGLWAWLAWIIAAMIALFAGAQAGNFAAGPGWDAAKKLFARFAK
jgi:hypothetical protein